MLKIGPKFVLVTYRKLGQVTKIFITDFTFNPIVKGKGKLGIRSYISGGWTRAIEMIRFVMAAQLSVLNGQLLQPSCK